MNFYVKCALRKKRYVCSFDHLVSYLITVLFVCFADECPGYKKKPAAPKMRLCDNKILGIGAWGVPIIPEKLQCTEYYKFLYN